MTSPALRSPGILEGILPEGRVSHKMDVRKSLPRRADTLVYAESHSSASPSPSKPLQQRPKTAQDVGAEGYTGDGENKGEKSEDEDMIQYASPNQRRAGLRTRRKNMSLKALENANASLDRSRKTTLNSEKTDVLQYSMGEAFGSGTNHAFDFPPSISSRATIRQEIRTHTKALRDAFLFQQKDYFLPLLPKTNYVRKLAENYERLSIEETAKLPATSPYDEIEVQPRGVVAAMKPYQLSGLSFLMYLHRNGLSGILGDEMGLGKTLQTLSLIQHLKETDQRATSGRQQRPFLIVCPLSVLSSWMAEVKKWCPGLKAVRFHGPVQERQRLKKIVCGELDMYGNLTSHGKQKTHRRRNGKARQSSTSEAISNEEHDTGVDLVVTTYDSFKAEQSWFKSVFVWRYIVLDEGHTIKNHTSLISKSLHSINAEYRLILTGTPLQNNLSELWALLAWLYPEVFVAKTNELFDSSFNLSKGHFSSSALDDARRLLELIMLRRMKSSPGVELGLPAKTEVILFVPLSPMQRFWYTRIITKADQGLLEDLFKDLKTKSKTSPNNHKATDTNKASSIEIEAECIESLDNASVIGTNVWKDTRAILEQTVQREMDARQRNEKKTDWQKLMNLLMQLRKVCNHPYQIANAEPNPYETGDHVISASGKFIILEKLISELVVKQKKKILIFSGFTLTLNLVEELLFLKGGNGSSFSIMRIDGATCRARRNLGIRLFNDSSSDYRVMLISTRAGGLGINLATASDVVLMDQDWNPQITLQAEARAHRIGQKNPVTVYKLVSQGTVEEQMMGRIQKKLYLSAKVTEAMEDIYTKHGAHKHKAASSEEKDMPHLKTRELMTLIRGGAAALAKPETDINDMLGWDWETTVAKCRDQSSRAHIETASVKDSKADEQAEMRWLSEMERVESSIFDGKKLAKASKSTSNRDIAQEYFSKEHRRINKHTTVMVDGFAVSKQSMDCQDWEAVPTMAGKDPTLAEPKRKSKTRIEHQAHCQVCVNGGELYCCQLCPRAYHLGCLDIDFQKKAKGWQFSCPQHTCFDCTQNTQMAGGMLYRCRWCERAYCEDCLDFDKTILIGDNLQEFQLRDYPEMTQAFYIQCNCCTDHFMENPDDEMLCRSMAEGIRHEHEERFGDFGRAASLGLESLTEATTAYTSSVNTPKVEDDYEDVLPPRKHKTTGGCIEIPLKRRKLSNVKN